MGGWVASLDPGAYWLLLTIAAATAAFGLFGGFGALRRARRIEDIATARIASAPQGYVELEGTAWPLRGEGIVAPLSQRNCCWYSFSLWRRQGDKWQLAGTGRSDQGFILRDGSGECLILPKDAEITPEHSRSWRARASELPALQSHSGLFDGGSLSLSFGSSRLDLGVGIGIGAAERYRCSEKLILPGDHIYALGWFRSRDELHQQRAVDQRSRELLRDWKQRPATLLERFDDDRDGRLDEHEWQQARDAAARQAAEDQAATETETQIHRLGRPPRGEGPFLVSSIGQARLVRRYRWLGRGGLVLFLGAGSIATLLITTRLLAPH